MADTDTDFTYYHYEPSLIAAIVITCLFAVSSALHVYQIIRTRAMYMIPFIIGAIIEVVGFGGRIWSSIEAPDYTLPPYIIQAILILIAPGLLAATVYMVLGYIILAVDGERHSMIQKKFLTKIFVMGDIFSFLIQSSGAGLLTKKDKDAPKAGKWIIVGGLVIQLLFFGLFIVVSVVFYVRLSRKPTRESKSGKVTWRLHMWTLFTASTLIMIRSVFRVIEYLQGVDGYLFKHEFYLYIFDAALMLGVVILFNLVHPSQITSLLTGRPGLYMILKTELKERLTGQEDEEKPLSRLSERIPIMNQGGTDYARAHQQVRMADFRSG